MMVTGPMQGCHICHMLWVSLSERNGMLRKGLLGRRPSCSTGKKLDLWSWLSHLFPEAAASHPACPGILDEAISCCHPCSTWRCCQGLLISLLPCTIKSAPYPSYVNPVPVAPSLDSALTLNSVVPALGAVIPHEEAALRNCYRTVFSLGNILFFWPLGLRPIFCFPMTFLPAHVFVSSFHRWSYWTYI